MITYISYFQETIHVDELRSGSRGMCPYCKKAKMTVKTSKYGIKFASLMPGEKHSKDECIANNNRFPEFHRTADSGEHIICSPLYNFVVRDGVFSKEYGRGLPSLCR